MRILCAEKIIFMRDDDLNPGARAMAGGTHGFIPRTYYILKPFMSQNFRRTLRRMMIPRILTRSADRWPIDENACGRPSGWTGWPDGKRFALVLTHDVESELGLEKVKRLADLELTYGFRSSYNFIPEGSYEDPTELRSWLIGEKFEVGVHDFNHDGHLYDSRISFGKKAKKINCYLHKWGAVGFRSGFMLRQLEWLHDLDILYDTSTFDTDPFEPQPEGSRTIFPFRVASLDTCERSGYIELSYTLPQDSTLFLLLKHKTADVWKNKLDWIVRNGGMALVNIHPDYIDFSHGGNGRSTYPISLLLDFVDYIRSEYNAEYWNPVARELAVWYADMTSYEKW